MWEQSFQKKNGNTIFWKERYSIFTFLNLEQLHHTTKVTMS